MRRIAVLRGLLPLLDALLTLAARSCCDGRALGEGGALGRDGAAIFGVAGRGGAAIFGAAGRGAGRAAGGPGPSVLPGRRAYARRDHRDADKNAVRRRPGAPMIDHLLTL